jgi:hypothetical protein
MPGGSAHPAHEEVHVSVSAATASAEPKRASRALAPVNGELPALTPVLPEGTRAFAPAARLRPEFSWQFHVAAAGTRR